MQELDISAPSGMEVRAQLISALRLVIESQQLSQSAAARLIATDQPTLSKILSGDTSGITIDRLISWLDRLGHNVDIRVSSRRPISNARVICHG